MGLKPKIGFIGQGFIGKNYADDFEERGYAVVRYDVSDVYRGNRDAIAGCDIVFIAVPTPTLSARGCDTSIVGEVLLLVGKGKIAVIKSTIPPNATDMLQTEFPTIDVFHSPEFLTASNAAHDARHPQRNIVGYTDKSKKRADEVMAVLPDASYKLITTAANAAAIKYGGNIWLMQKVLFMNTLYDFCKHAHADFSVVTEGMAADPRIGSSHLQVVHEGGRGAGGHCLPKDLASYIHMYEHERTGGIRGYEELALAYLRAGERYNAALLKETGKK
jgi:UDPglucose 6-dehydrogenase